MHEIIMGATNSQRFARIAAAVLCAGMVHTARADDLPGLGGPSSVRADLQPGDGITDPQFRSKHFQEIFSDWFDWKARLAAEHNISFSLDYLMLGQWSTSNTSTAGVNSAGSGIARFYGAWSPTPNGALTFKVEHRHAYVAVAPQFFGLDQGALAITGTAFNDIGLALTNLYWTQRADDRRWTIQAGQIDVTDFVDVYGLVSPYTSFQNLAFNTNPTINAPNPGLGLAGGLALSDNFYLVGSIADANGDPTSPDLDVFHTGETFKSVELGFMSSQDRIYFDNVHVTLWQSDAGSHSGRPEDYGAVFSAAWLLENKWMPFFRAGASRGTAALYNRSVSAGLGMYTRQTDLAGIGVNWAQAFGLPGDQFTAEAFYRFTASQNFAVTGSLQFIANPLLDPGQDHILFGGLRARLQM